jgi:hypothetical protein
MSSSSIELLSHGLSIEPIAVYRHHLRKGLVNREVETNNSCIADLKNLAQ